MKFPRTKKVVFCNNKGGVGKTTLSFHCGIEFAKKGYKTVLIDLDPQCNLTLLTLGGGFYEDNLFSKSQKTIYDVLKPKIEGAGDIDFNVDFSDVRENLHILPGDIKLSLFENLITNGYLDATSGNMRGYSDTSSIYRFLNKKGMDEGIDIFIIDTSPSLGILNRIIFLGADYFLVPMMADSFSVQGIENLGTVFEQWEKQWKNTAKAVAGSTPQDHLLQATALFIGYVINSFNVYGEKVVKRQREWLEKIPNEVKKYLSEKHSRNGMVEKSWKTPLYNLQDYGQLTAISMDNNLAVSEFNNSKVKELNLQGTQELHKKACAEFEGLANNILDVFKDY
ncbi:AAA family ATPase [Patescibacteria group bacterium]|nr:AAA family ATPase [Patescibacteria group bacterium]